ncbi:hypothetical protein [Kingella kingae]|nr:hypothetical protein [Kingella kingae]
MQSQREWLEQHIVQQYGALPEFLWTKYPLTPCIVTAATASGLRL